MLFELFMNRHSPYNDTNIPHVGNTFKQSRQRVECLFGQWMPGPHSFRLLPVPVTTAHGKAGGQPGRQRVAFQCDSFPVLSLLFTLFS